MRLVYAVPMTFVFGYAIAACGNGEPAKPVVDAAQADAAQADAALGCDAACKAFTATLTKGAASLPLERAFWGANGPVDAPTSVRVELYRGGENSCPEMNSPSPKQTVVIAALPVMNGAIAGNDTSSAVSLLDFRGALTMAAIARATSKQMLNGRSSLAATPGFVAFDINATIEGGIVLAGHVYATHCASLDERP